MNLTEHAGTVSSTLSGRRVLFRGTSFRQERAVIFATWRIKHENVALEGAIYFKTSNFHTMNLTYIFSEARRGRGYNTRLPTVAQQLRGEGGLGCVVLTPKDFAEYVQRHEKFAL